MTNRQHIHERIEDYIHNRMSEQERLGFEQDIASDNSLETLVNEARITDEAVYMASLGELRKNIGSDIKKVKYNSGLSNSTYVFIALALVLAVFITKELFFTPSSDNESVSVIINEQIEVNIPSSHELETPILIEDTTQTKIEVVKNRSEASTITTKEKQIVDHQLTTKQVLDQNPPIIQDQKMADPSRKKEDINAKLDTSTKNTQLPNTITEVCDKTFELIVEPSCKNKENGTIQILSDGLLKYDFTVNELKNTGATGMFYNLPVGKHTIEVRYKQNCLYTTSTVIAEKWCPVNTSFSFNPDYNESWEINYEEGDVGNYMIYNKIGKQVYEATFGRGNERWNGTDANGVVLPVGTYVAFIHYTDGRTEKVELTIIR